MAFGGITGAATWSFVERFPYYNNRRTANISDSLSNGQSLRVLTVVDDHTRECVAVEVDTSLPGERVCRVLEAAVGQRGRPMSIVVDNGPDAETEAVARGRRHCCWPVGQSPRSGPQT